MATAQETVQAEDFPANDNAAVAVRAPDGVVMGSCDDAGSNNIKLSKLKISYGDSIGKLTGYNPGDFVLDGTDLIATKGEKLNVIVISYSAYWKENLPFGTPMELIRTFKTREEVLAAGGTLTWVNDPKTGKGVGPTFREACTIDMLIERPKDLICSMFCIPVQDKLYAPCRYFTDKANAEGLLVELRRTKKLLNGGSLLRAVFELWTTLKIYKNGNKSYISALKLVRSNTPEVLKELEDQLAGKSMETATAEATDFEG